ncbi:MAG: PAS domain-containing sensor histidine kinase, partial [Deltaproteobacteria bacterium]
MHDDGRADSPLVAAPVGPFERAFERSPVPQLLLRHGRVVAANAAARETLQLSLHALVDRPASAFLPGLDDALDAGLPPGAPPMDREITVCRLDGPDDELLVSLCPPRTGPTADASRDGGERRFAAMLAHMPLLWFRLDATGVFRDVHVPSGMKLLAPPEVFLGRRLEDVLPPALAETARAALNDAIAGGAPLRFDYPAEVDGAERWYQCHMLLAGDDDVFSYVTDITTRKASEEAMQRAVEEAREAALTRTRFLAAVSHEVRTPINGILGMADLLSDTPLDEEQEGYVAMLHSAGRALLNVINDVLDFTKIEAGHLRLEPTAFSPRDVVEGVMTLLAERAHGRGLELGARIAHDVPATVVGDANRVAQVLLNLVGNAIKFTLAGSVAVRVDVLHAAADKQVLRFAVADTGIGIAPAVLPKLFAPFEQGDPLTTRRFGGTGLGLAISRRLTDLMEGEITVESEVDRGSVFTFDLPADLPAGVPRTPRRPRPPAALAASGRPLRVIGYTPGARLREQLDHELPAAGATLWT